MLRARIEDDVAVLHEGLYEDVAIRSRTDLKPWRPIPAGSQSPFAPRPPDDGTASFSVVELATDSLAGSALLWGIDPHNRTAHLGVALLPDFRGLGLSTDVLNVLCHYGFTVLGLHRLQVDTLADNIAMIRAAERAGFTREGTLRESAWVAGRFLDDVILGRLAPDVTR